jgi:hypothetical protein
VGRSFGQLTSTIDALAGGLLARGLRPDDVVAAWWRGGDRSSRCELDWTRQTHAYAHDVRRRYILRPHQIGHERLDAADHQFRPLTNVERLRAASHGHRGKITQADIDAGSADVYPEDVASLAIERQQARSAATG